MIFAPYVIIPPEKPAIVRASDFKGLPSWQEMQRRERAIREGSFPFPFIVPTASTPATLTYVGTTQLTTDLTTYTFTAHAVSTAATGRRIFVGCHTLASPAVSLSSGTIGGNAATVHQTTTDSLTTSAIMSAVLNTGTTADIVVTWSGGAARCRIGVWAAYDLINSTPTDTGTSTASPPTDTINIDAGGVCVAVSSTRYDTTGATISWTGLTEAYDALGEGANENYSGAGDAFATTQTGLTITATPTGSSEEALSVVSFR